LPWISRRSVLELNAALFLFGQIASGRPPLDSVIFTILVIQAMDNLLDERVPDARAIWLFGSISRAGDGAASIGGWPGRNYS
jgi:hypothetical protein